MSGLREKKIGKIKNVSFGIGGYQDCMIGISFDLGSDKECWGVGSFKGAWSPSQIKVSEHSKWTEEDRSKQLDETMRYIDDLLYRAKKQDVMKLVGVPVEVTFDGNTLKEWRILEEVI